MAAIAHGDTALGRKLGIPKKVAVDFNQADAGTGILSKPRGKLMHLVKLTVVLSPPRGRPSTPFACPDPGQEPEQR